MKKYVLTRKAKKIFSEAVFIDEEKPISYSNKLSFDKGDCAIGEAEIVVSLFSSNLKNKKYFKEVKV